MIPQLIYLALVLVGLGLSLSLHGKPKTGTHNFFIHIIAVLITLFILYKGHFFDVLIKLL